MQVSTGKLQILTAAAILVLISGGIAVYAQNQTTLTFGAASAAASNTVTTDAANSTSTQTSGTSSTSQTSATSSTSTVTSTVTSTKTVTTTSTTSTTTANQTLCQPTSPIPVGRLVLPITAIGSSASSGGSISFSNTRGCVASITTIGGIFKVEITLRYAKPVTQYNVVLVANGTSYTLGNMVTGPDGSGQMQNQVLLTPGTYVVSIQIFDTSSNPGHSTLVLQTGQGKIVSPPFPTTTSTAPPNQGQGQSGQHR